MFFVPSYISLSGTDKNWHHNRKSTHTNIYVRARFSYSISFCFFFFCTELRYCVLLLRGCRDKTNGKSCFSWHVCSFILFRFDVRFRPMNSCHTDYACLNLLDHHFAVIFFMNHEIFRSNSLSCNDNSKVNNYSFEFPLKSIIYCICIKIRTHK